MENSENHFEPRDRYKVKWLVNALGIKGKSEEEGVLGVSLGFCEKNPGKIAKLCPAAGGIGSIAPFIVRDVLVAEDGSCEERKRCLCLDCEHNETTLRSLWGGYRWAEVILETEGGFRKLVKRMRRVEEILEEDIGELDWNSNETTAYREPELMLYPSGTEEEPEGDVVRL